MIILVFSRKPLIEFEDDAKSAQRIISFFPRIRIRVLSKSPQSHYFVCGFVKSVCYQRPSLQYGGSGRFQNAKSSKRACERTVLICYTEFWSGWEV